MMLTRLRGLLVVGAVLASLLLPASAAAQTTYNLTGVEVNANPATFIGVLAGQPGTWQAVIQHDPLNTSTGGITAITGGAFSISPLGASTITGNVTSGQLKAGPVLGSFFCTQSFVATGSLMNGSFDGVLKHYGVRSSAGCSAFFATFSGSSTIG